MVEKETTTLTETNPLATTAAVPAWLIAVLSFLGGILLEWIKNVTAKAAAGSFAMHTMTAFKGLVMTAPDRAVEWLSEAADAFKTPTGAWAVFVSEVLETLTGEYIDPKPFMKEGIGPGSRRAINQLGVSYLQPLLNLIMPRAIEVNKEVGLTKWDGLHAANRFFGVNLEFQMKAWLLHMLGDTFSFGMWKAMKDLPNAISWSFGIGWLSWLVMGTPFRMTIAEPLEWLYNDIYRPFRFSIPKLADAYWRGLITLRYFRQHMAEAGVPDYLFDVIVEMERTKISDAQAYKLYRMRKLSRANLIDHHRAQGHSPEDSELLATEMTSRETRELIQDIAEVAMKHYKDRRMSPSELREFLAEAGWRRRERDLIVQKLNMERALEAPEETRYRRLSPANVGRLYNRKLRTRQWAELKLTDLGFKPEEIDDFLALYRPKVEKEPEPREPPASLVGLLYQRGMITLERAKGHWQELNLSSSYIALLSMRYAPPPPPPPPPPRKFSPTEVGRLYREHAITRRNALRRLTRDPIRMKPEEAELYLDTFYKPKEVTEPPPREAPVHVVGSLYKKGQITKEVFLEHLDTLGFSPKSKKFLIKYYSPPPEEPVPPTPPRELQPSTIGRLYREGGISREEAIERLIHLEPPMTVEDAIIYIDTLYSPEV